MCLSGERRAGRDASNEREKGTNLHLLSRLFSEPRVCSGCWLRKDRSIGIGFTVTTFFNFVEDDNWALVGSTWHYFVSHGFVEPAKKLFCLTNTQPIGTFMFQVIRSKILTVSLIEVFLECWGSGLHRLCSSSTLRRCWWSGSHLQVAWLLRTLKVQFLFHCMFISNERLPCQLGILSEPRHEHAVASVFSISFSKIKSQWLTRFLDYLYELHDQITLRVSKKHSNYSKRFRNKPAEDPSTESLDSRLRQSTRPLVHCRDLPEHFIG